MTGVYTHAVVLPLQHFQKYLTRRTGSCLSRIDKSECIDPEAVHQIKVLLEKTNSV